METKFTKGVWQICRPDSIECQAKNVWYIESYSDSGMYRGSVASSQSAEHISGISNEEAEANLHLLFAAPDLYAALERLSNMASFEAGTANPGQPFWDALEQARVILRKAREGSNG